MKAALFLLFLEAGAICRYAVNRLQFASCKLQNYKLANCKLQELFFPRQKKKTRNVIIRGDKAIIIFLVSWIMEGFHWKRA